MAACAGSPGSVTGSARMPARPSRPFARAASAFAILSGDHPDVVRRVASELGLPDEDALGGLTPEAKRDIVAQLG